MTQEVLMNEIQKVDLRQLGAWLSRRVEIRVPRAWLVPAGGVGLVLLLVALD